MAGIDSLLGGMGGLGGEIAGAGATGGLSLIPAALQIGSSIVQNISAAKKKKQADSLMPGTVDPHQAAFLAELNQKRKAIDTGADFGAGMNAINSTNASTNEALTRASGGDTGATIQGLLGAQRVAGDAGNNVIAQGQQQQMGYNSMYNDLNNKMAARAMQIQMQRSQQARAEWAQKKQTANQNMMSGVAGLFSGGAPKIPGLGGEEAEMMNSQGGPNTSLMGGTGGDSANAPDLGKGGVFPELMGSAASGILDNIGK